MPPAWTISSFDGARWQLALQRLGQPAHLAAQLVPVHRRPHDRAIVVDRARDVLPDPPHGVGGELDVLGGVELLDRAEQTERPLLDQIGQRKPATRVLARDRGDQAKLARSIASRAVR
jgi:hypothetical protein